MKKHIIISLCLQAIFISAQAQQDTLFYKLGQEQFDKKNYKKGIAYFSQAIEVNKKYAEAYYRRSSCYFMKKAYKKSLEDCNTALLLKPEDSDSYNLKGRIYESTKNIEEAVINYNKAIKYDSSNAIAWNNKACVFDSRGEFTKAEHDYLQAVKYGKKEDLGLYYTNLGATYFNNKKYTSAIEELTHAIELNWPDKDIYLIRAMAYEAIGKTNEANEDRKKAKEFKVIKGDTITH